MYRIWVILAASSMMLFCNVARCEGGTDTDLERKRQELAAASNQITAACAGLTDPSGRPEVNCSEGGNLVRKLFVYNHMNEQRKELAAISNQILAKCAGRSDADCNGASATAKQTLEELDAASAAESEWFQAMGFPGDVRSLDSFKAWFVRGLSSDADSTLDRGQYAIEFAKREVTEYCSTIYGIMYGTNSQADYRECVQNYHPEMVSAMHEYSWAFCFAKYDWMGNKPRGTRRDYDACMSKNNIYSAFCSQKALAAYNKFQRSSPDPRRVPPRPCGGPVPTGREIQMLRMRANQLGITAPTSLTQIGNNSTTPLSTDSTPAVVPVGSMLTIKTVEQIDVNGVKSGKSFRAQLNYPLHFEGKEIIPQGADIFLKASVKQGGGWVLVSVDYAVVKNMKLPLETTDIMLAVPSLGGQGQASAPGHIRIPQFPHGGLQIPTPTAATETSASNAILQKAGSILMFRITGSR
jgi:hypothetical protein